MPPCCSGCPLARHVIVKSSLVFFIVSFPAPRFLCHGFRENLKIFFCRTLNARPTADCAHLVYQQNFWNSAEDFAKNSLFFIAILVIRPGNPCCTLGISTKILESDRDFRIFSQFFSTHPFRRAPTITAIDFAHRVYRGLKSKMGNDFRKKSQFF